MKAKAIKMADLKDKVPAVLDSNSKAAVPQETLEDKPSPTLGLEAPLPEPKDIDISSIPVPLALGAIILMVFLPLLQTDLWWLRGSIAWAVLSCKALTIVKAIAVIIGIFYRLDLKGLTHVVQQTRGKVAPNKAASALDRTKASESLHAFVVLALAACCMPWVGGLARAVFGDVLQQGMHLGAFVWMYPYINVVLELFNRCAVLSGVLLVAMKLPRWLRSLSFDELYRVCIFLVVLCSVLLAKYLPGHH